MRNISLGALALVFVGGVALANSAGITNEDNEPYSYEVQCGAATSRGTAHHGHNAWSGSVRGCKLKVQGAGTAKVDNNTVCTIKNHMLDCN